MAQLILMLLIAGIAWFGYRKFVADAERLSRQRRRSEDEQKNGAIGTLIKDPKTGEYRVRRDDD